jgi:hypothetical protein
MVISKASSENNATVEINNLEYKKNKIVSCTALQF